MIDRLPAPLQRLPGLFNARPMGERRLMVCAAMALAVAAGDALFLTPALDTWKVARQREHNARDALDVLRNDLALLATRHQANGQQSRQDVASWRQRLRDGEEAMRAYEDTLVGPDQMNALLDQLLARHGQLRVRQMRTLPRVDLLAPAATPGAAASAPAAPPQAPANANAAASGASAGARPAAPAAPATTAAAPAPAPAAAAAEASLYRHGVELTLEGTYPELVAYLRALEAQPRRVLWGLLSIRVEQHPTTVMTLRLYTISRDRHWIEI